MEKSSIQNELQLLERKINLLLNEYTSNKEKNKSLIEENKLLTKQLKIKTEQVQNFQNQIKISTIAETIETDSKDASELKDKIEDYVNKIDYCIAQLSQ